MASINFNLNLTTLCADSRIYLLRRRRNYDEDEGGLGNSVELITQLDLNSFELDAKMEKETESKGKKVGNKVRQNHSILTSSLSNNSKFLAVATSTKIIVVFDIAAIICSSEDDSKSAQQLPPFCLPTPKNPTAVYFSNDDRILFVSDRSGSVHEFAISETGLTRRRELLGHLSMLLDFCLSPQQKFILTSDRDEKIRVSRYPDTFIIEGFCLGHTSFVNTILCLDESLLVSAGGDSVIRLWDFRNAKCFFTSPKICDSPIRKIRSTQQMEQNSTAAAAIIVLPDGCNYAEIFKLDNEKKFLYRVGSVKCEDPDEKLADFCVDQNRRTIYCVGRNSIYYCEIHEQFTGVAMLRPIEVRNCDGATIWKDLARCEDKYPLDQLYKVVAFGNVENYQEGKEQKRRRKSQSEQ